MTGYHGNPFLLASFELHVVPPTASVWTALNIATTFEPRPRVCSSTREPCPTLAGRCPDGRCRRPLTAMSKRVKTAFHLPRSRYRGSHGARAGISITSLGFRRFSGGSRRNRWFQSEPSSPSPPLRMPTERCAVATTTGSRRCSVPVSPRRASLC